MKTSFSLLYLSIACLLALTFNAAPAYADEVTAADLQPFKTTQLQTRLGRTRILYAAHCPMGVVSDVLSTGIQLIPFLSVVNPMMGRSADWDTADWATAEAMHTDRESNIYVTSLGGALVPVYDLAAGTIRTLGDVVRDGQLRNEFKFETTRMAGRILLVQYSRGVGARSKCQKFIREASLLKTEIRRRKLAGQI